MEHVLYLQRLLTFSSMYQLHFFNGKGDLVRVSRIVYFSYLDAIIAFNRCAEHSRCRRKLDVCIKIVELVPYIDE